MIWPDQIVVHPERLGFEKSGETNFHYQMVKPKNVKLTK
jgi:hypothetical protein